MGPDMSSWAREPGRLCHRLGRRAAYAGSVTVTAMTEPAETRKTNVPLSRPLAAATAPRTRHALRRDKPVLCPSRFARRPQGGGTGPRRSSSPGRTTWGGRTTGRRKSDS